VNEATLVKIDMGLQILGRLIEVFQQAQAAGETEMEVPAAIAAAFAALDAAELELDFAIAKAEGEKNANG